MEPAQFEQQAEEQDRQQQNEPGVMGISRHGVLVEGVTSARMTWSSGSVKSFLNSQPPRWARPTAVESWVAEKSKLRKAGSCGYDWPIGAYLMRPAVAAP